MIKPTVTAGMSLLACGVATAAYARGHPGGVLLERVRGRGDAAVPGQAGAQ